MIQIETNLWEEGQGEGYLGTSGSLCTPHLFKMDNQQGPTACHRELCSTFCNSLNENRICKRIDTSMWVTVSLCYTLETNTTLLINYILIKNKKLKRKKSLTYFLEIMFGLASTAGYMNKGIFQYLLNCIFNMPMYGKTNTVL